MNEYIVIIYVLVFVVYFGIYLFLVIVPLKRFLKTSVRHVG